MSDKVAVPAQKCVSCGSAIVPPEKPHLGVCLFCRTQIYERIKLEKREEMDAYCAPKVEALNVAREKIKSERAELKNLQAASKLVELIKEIR